MTSANPSEAAPAGGTGRLVSLDALRGFTMFWILGADVTVLALARWLDVAPLRAAAYQVEHAPWAGFRFYDLVFPMFVFITGVSLVFSVGKSLARDARGRVVRHILIRTGLLFLLGILYNGGLSQPWPEVRLVGVLQRIGIAYGVAALLVVFASARVRVAISCVLLLGYWAVMAWVPVRDIALDREAMTAHFGGVQPYWIEVRALYDSTEATVTGRYEPGLNVAHHLDFLCLPGAKYDVYWDPEGLLSTIPAIVTCLLGTMAGAWLRRTDRTPGEKVRVLIVAGLACLVVGGLWGLAFPIVKKLWTSSFVLVAGGWSLLLLAAFFWLIDVRRWASWSRPFVWIGMNPITLYLATSLVDFGRIASLLAGGSVAGVLDHAFGSGAAAFVNAALVLALLLGLARFLHQRRIFLKV